MLTAHHPGLWSGPPSPHEANPALWIRSFVLEGRSGRVVVYNSPALHQADAGDVGHVSHVLLSHAHEATYGDPTLTAPTLVHRRDRRASARCMRVADVFDHRQMLLPGLEAIPTPGHTPGSTCFLWDSGTHRTLFTGDFLWVSGGAWQVALLQRHRRPAYLASLQQLRSLDFDVLAPWGSPAGEPAAITVDRTEIPDRIDAITERLHAGSTR